LKDAAAIVVSTAHPAKFDTIVEPLIGKTVEVPQNLAKLLDKESHFISVGTDYHQLFE
jgi:threonine synthase